MSDDEKLEQNINRAKGLHALRKINTILEKEKNSEEDSARALRWLLRYGWLALLLPAAILAYLIGVF